MKTDRNVNIIFVLAEAYYPQFNNRIVGLKNEGADVRAVAFNRDNLKPRDVCDDYTIVGNMKKGRYHKRIGLYLKAMQKIRSSLPRINYIYASGLDLLFLSHLVRFFSGYNPQIIYEVIDIRAILIENTVVSRILRFVERFLVQRSYLVVVSSSAYIRGYFKGIQGLEETNYFVIENKVGRNYLNYPRQSDNNQQKKIRIGYFGLIRCRHSLKALHKAAELYPELLEIKINGIPRETDDLLRDIQKLPNVTYGGSYKAPEDLPGIYGNVDIVWIAIYHDKSNVEWSRVIRFYESCYYGKPMIGQIHTEDGREILKYQIGLCTDIADAEKTAAELGALTRERINKWTRNIEALPQEMYIETDEYTRLYKILKNAGAEKSNDPGDNKRSQ